MKPLNHPHFEPIEGVPDGYRSKATGACVVLLRSRGEVRAVPLTLQGERLPIHAEAIAFAVNEWDALDAVHAMR